jgi:hypothetical protein
VLAAAGALLAVAVFVAWAGFARQAVPLRTLLAVPLYIVWKLPMYVAFLFRRQKAWVRTERDAVAGSDTQGTRR